MTRNTHSMAASFAVAAILAAMVLVGTSGTVWPHMAPSGEFMYPPGCCHSAATSPTGDCAPIPPQSVVAGPDGYRVSLGIGQHPKLKTKGYSEVIPYSLTRVSEDGQFHICLSTDGVSRFCFFAPPPAS